MSFVRDEVSGNSAQTTLSAPRMGRYLVPFLAVCGVVLPSVAASSPSKTPTALDEADPLPAQCVEASQADHPTRDDTLVLTLDNGCHVPVSCRIAWKVRCKGGDEHPVSHETSLEAGASREFEASAAVCQEAGWRITPPKWSCSAK